MDGEDNSSVVGGMRANALNQYSPKVIRRLIGLCERKISHFSVMIGAFEFIIAGAFFLLSRLELTFLLVPSRIIFWS